MSPKICPICRYSTRSPMTGNGNDGTYRIDCWQCGKYVISGSAVDDAESIPVPTDKRALASAWLVHNRPGRFDDQHLAFVRGDIRRPSMLHRAMSMLRWLSHQFPEGKQFSTNQFECPDGSARTRCFHKAGVAIYQKRCLCSIKCL